MAQETNTAGDASADLRIGVSGWRYAPWRGAFYPKGLVQDRELAYLSHQFPAAELNGSFYSLQRPQSYLRWAAETPPGFVFAVKGPRYITHTLRLRHLEQALPNFWASGVLALGPKLGPLLWQLPPTLRFDAALIDDFLGGLPRDTDAAAGMAQRRDPARMAGREWLEAPSPRLRLRHALEVRHESFIDPDFIALLRRHDVAFVVADTARRYPEFFDVTADFVYVRLHGATELYNSRYSDAELERWSEHIRAWAGGSQRADAPRIASEAPPPRAHRDVFCFFDNTDKRAAPVNAAQLLQRLGMKALPFE